MPTAKYYLFLVLLLRVSVRPADSQRTVLRIGLARQFSNLRAVSVSIPPGARIRDESGRESTIAVQDGRVQLDASSISERTLRIEPGSPESEPIEIRSGRTSRKYHGIIEIAAKTSALRIVNEVELESYLRGVVPAEMSTDAPIEALKAQAVAARTYALMNRDKHRKRGYDLCDDTDCQVCNGVTAERAATDAAVRDTAGMVLLRNGKMILADYYDDCGGVTSAGEPNDDYPPSVIDGPIEGGPDYCAKGTYHSWTARFTANELSSRITPLARGPIGKIQDFKIVTRDSSGRIRTAQAVGDQGSVAIDGWRLREMLGYSRLRSTLCSVSMESDGFVFTGKGWGHGHGLCQAGAMGMAAAPYRFHFKRILEHYYPGAVVTESMRTTAGRDPSRQY